MSNLSPDQFPSAPPPERASMKFFMTTVNYVRPNLAPSAADFADMGPAPVEGKVPGTKTGPVAPTAEDFADMGPAGKEGDVSMRNAIHVWPTDTKAHVDRQLNEQGLPPGRGGKRQPGGRGKNNFMPNDWR